MPEKSTCPSPSERKRPARSTQGWIAGIDALPPVRVELGILDVKRLDALVIDVDEVEIVELLQQKMRRVVIDAAARVVLQPGEEPLEGRHRRTGPRRDGARSRRRRRPRRRRRGSASSAARARRRPLDQAGRPLRPGIDERPGERAGKGRVRGRGRDCARPWRRASSARPPISGAPSACRARPAARRRRRPRR